MQDRQFIEFVGDGSTRIDLSQDETVENWHIVKRASVKHVRRYGTMVEDANEATAAVEEQIRLDVGFTPELVEVMKKAMSGEALENIVGVEMLDGADAVAMQNEYVRRLQRYLLSDENPYPAIWLELLNDDELMNPILGHRDDGELPMFAFGQEVIQELINHWTTVPLTLGAAQPPSQPSNRPGRAGSRASAASPSRSSRRASEASKDK